MAFRMARLKRSKSSGSWHSRKAIPEALRTAFGGRWEVRFHAPADCSPERARVLFSEWQADIDNQIKTARDKERGHARDLTQKEALALAGEWYRWYTTPREDNPGDASHWAKLHESCGYCWKM